MEEDTNVAVSLDELTLDLSGVGIEINKLQENPNNIDTNEPSFAFSFNSYENIPRDISSNSLNNYIEIDSSDDDPIETNQQCIEFTGTEDMVNFSSINNEEIDVDLGVEKPVDDFEIEIPPLDLFPSTRYNDSEESDSEFEVPDQPQEQKPKKEDSINISQDKLKSLSTPQDNYIITSNDVNPQSTLSEYLNSGFMTPRDKTVSDLSHSEISKYIVSSTNDDDLATLKQHEPSKICSELDEKQIKDTSLQPDEDTLKPNHLNNSEKHNTVQKADILKKVEDHSKEDKSQSDDELHKPSIVTTDEDWEGVQTVEAGFAKVGDNRPVSSEVHSKPLLTIGDAWDQFESFDYTSVKGQIRTQVERKGFSAFTHFLFGPPKLNKDLLPQRDIVYCIAATQMENANLTHTSLLQTVYRCLTGSKFDCQRFGGHWEEIGFQGKDPATDLRGTGMLALLHILFFLRDQNTKQLSRDVYKLSLHPTQNFPFCIMSINLSRICLQVFREGVFNNECNRRKSIMSTMNDVHSALYLYLYQLWRKGKTISDSGFILQEVEMYCRKQSKNIFKDKEKYEKQRKQQGPLGDHLEGEQSFFSVCKEDECDNKSVAELY